MTAETAAVARKRGAKPRSVSPRAAKAASAAGVQKYQQMREQLAKYKASTLAALTKYIPDAEPRKYLYDLVGDYPARGGKGFRPGLCLATCGAFGGNRSQAQPSAVALEFLHNAFLVHDDIEDGSISRRGKPTMHEREGVPIAINVGDAMNVLALRPLMNNVAVVGAKTAYAVMNEVEHLVRQSVEGQAMEIGWVRDNRCDLTDADYLRMILKKTCWYTCIHPVRIGALIATGTSRNLERFNRFGYYMGAAFQIQDDTLNLIGEEAQYGKEIAGDILEGKRTLMLVHLLRTATPREKRELKTFLAKPRTERSASEVAWILKLMQRHGSFDHGRKSARQLAGAALREFHAHFAQLPASADKQAIEDLVMYMVEREL